MYLVFFFNLNQSPVWSSFSCIEQVSETPVGWTSAALSASCVAGPRGSAVVPDGTVIRGTNPLPRVAALL